jgi:hypothetical protein
MTPLRALVLVGTAGVIGRWLIYRDGPALPRGPLIAALLVVGWLVLSVARDPSNATLREGFSLSVGTLAPAVLAAWAVRSAGDRERLVRAILGAISFAAVLGIFEVVAHHRLLHPVDGYVFTAGDRSGLLRAQSVFPQPIVFGVALAMCLPLALERARRSRIAAAQSILIALALLGTVSRGPWLGAALALVVLALSSSKHRVSGLLAITVALSCVYVGSATVRGQLSEALHPTSHEYIYVRQYRQALLAETLREMRRSPLATHLDPSQAAAMVVTVAGVPVNLSTAVDNTYARYGLEIGAFGLALVGFLLLSVLRATYMAGERTLAASQIAMLFCAATVGTLTFPQIGVLYWLLAGAAFGMWRQARARNAEAATSMRGLT